MADRQRLSLWVAILITSLSIPAPAAQTAEVITPVPFGALLTALDLDQTVPDAACVARCATTRDRETAGADAMLRDRRYYSNFDSNCWTLTGGPNCAATRQTCREACAPKYDNACTNACETPFQSCCAANDRTRAARDYDACVVKCPATKAPVTSPTTPTGLDVMKDSSKSIDTALGVSFAGWGKEMLIAWEAYQATRPPADRAADDARRAEAFNEVRADLAKTHAAFAVVSGGGGRLWILRPGGESILVDPNDVGYIRLGMRGSMDDHLALAKRLHLSPDEIMQLTGTVETWPSFGSDFKSGQVLTFHPGMSGGRGAPVRKGSSEHTSIRGTINGGGDFI